MIKILEKFFGKYDFEPVIKKISSLELDFEKLSDNELKEKSFAVREKISNGVEIGEFIIEAFALVRESAKRNLKQRHFDTQLFGGLVLHRGKIAEMATGEGKTLAATAPAYLNSLTGKGVHIITVNDYLAKRDAVWMGQVYYALGVSTACLAHDVSYIYDPTYIMKKEESEQVDKERDITGGFKIFHEFLRPVSREEAYKADIIYGTNHEFGFDYLKDNLAYRAEDQVQRGHYFAIIDEVDSILIDEARTPLIIAAPDSQSSQFYHVFSKIVSLLNKEEDYTVDEKLKSVSILPEGINKVEKALGIKDLYGPENMRLVHYLEESLKAKSLFHRDKNYVVKNGEVIIVDEFTGRLMPGRRYSGGLHQAIEAKESVKIQEESRTFAKITLQNYFRMYEKISGMTGTAQTSAEEFDKVYNLEVVSVPTNKPMIRKNLSDIIYKNSFQKYKAVVEDIKRRNKKGQPILIGTASIEHNEILSRLLEKSGIKHEILNAKNHEREAEIIAQAGKLNAVTVATNMAGRGVDIILGGNPLDSVNAAKVRELGGLHVIGTDRHEARRIDNQLRGRSGRQGDPGSSQFFLSLEDDLIRIFGGEKIKNLMVNFNLPEDMPIESKIVGRVVNEAQKKIEGFNFDARKHLLEYDNVLNKQRKAVYKKRLEILKGDLNENFEKIAFSAWERIKESLAPADLNSAVIEIGIVKKEELPKIGDFDEIIKQKISALINKENEYAIKNGVLGILDSLWMNHLEDLESLSESVRLRAYGQHDPLVEYQRESRDLFENLFRNFEMLVFSNAWKWGSQRGLKQSSISAKPVNFGKVGRNDPCPCGSGKKYKRCHGS